MKKYIFLLPFIFLFTSCNQDDSENVVCPNEIRFNIEHPSSCITRVTDTSFESNDRVGIYLTDASLPLDFIGNYLDNIALTFDGTSWNSTIKAYWNNGSYNAYAYYPYDGSISSIDDYPFSVRLDQSTKEEYEKSDFLWACSKNVTSSAEGVNLQFKHEMSRMMIILQKSDTYEGELPEDAEVYIHNTIPESTIDLGVGVPTRYAKGTAKTIHARKLSKNRYCAIIVPQRLSNRVPLVEVIANGVSYLYESKFNFQSGIQHNVNLTISKNPEQIKIDLGGQITNWTE